MVELKPKKKEQNSKKVVSFSNLLHNLCIYETTNTLNQMKRVITSFKNANKDLLRAISEEYPKGVDDEALINFPKAGGGSIRALEIIMDDCMYLVKMENQEYFEKYLALDDDDEDNDMADDDLIEEELDEDIDEDLDEDIDEDLEATEDLDMEDD